MEMETAAVWAVSRPRLNREWCVVSGSVRPQSLQRPSFAVTTTTPSTTSASTTTTIRTPVPTLKDVLTTTECPPNVTGSAVSQNTLRPPGNSNNYNLFRKLASSHYQSYTTALTVTIAVGCFLLLLNILIFAGIYHQRDRNGGGSFGDKKEELMEAGSCSSSSGDMEAKHALAAASPLSGQHKISGSTMEISLQEFKSSPPSALKKGNCTNPQPPSYDPPPDPPKMHRSITSALSSPMIPEPPPPPKNQPPPPCQLGGGILRQQGVPQTPSCSKKRVQIQEISV